MELFSEIYGCYFTVVSRLLEQAQNGLSKAEMEELVAGNGFYYTTFHLLPNLFSGAWNLFRKQGDKYYAKLSCAPKRPYTALEKSWLKAVSADPRMQLFLGREQLAALQESLSGTAPLFLQEDFYIYDRHRDGDDYTDPGYAARFQRILKAIKERRPLIIEYVSEKRKRSKKQYYPYKLCYSARDDKFRLQCAAFRKGKGRLQRITLNLARIVSLEDSGDPFVGENLELLFRKALCSEPVVFEISQERNALERCMLQFASFERQTEYDRERGIYTCRIWFDTADETELLIRILSFGPVIKVLGPERFLEQVKERIRRQIGFFCADDSL